MTNWTAVEDELARWTDLGRRCSLWLRDDDAIAASPQLDRLLQRCAQADIPLGLAVIPADAGPSLAQALVGHPNVTPLVHGWSHTDHAAPGAKKCEFGPERPAEIRQAEAERGLSVLRALFGDRLLPLFVPPWNRMAADMPSRLSAAGYRAVSAFGPAPASRAEGGDGITWINTHLDLIDWHGTRSAAPLDGLLDLLCRELRDRREGRQEGRGNPAEPIGLLTHHLVHDAAIWDLLDRLLDRLAGHPAVEWPGIGGLV